MAGALAHGPQEAMGEDVRPVILGKRKSINAIDHVVSAKQIRDVGGEGTANSSRDYVGAQQIKDSNEVGAQQIKDKGSSNEVGAVQTDYDRNKSLFFSLYCCHADDLRGAFSADQGREDRGH